MLFAVYLSSSIIKNSEHIQTYYIVQWTPIITRPQQWFSSGPNRFYCIYISHLQHHTTKWISKCFMETVFILGLSRQVSTRTMGKGIPGWRNGIRQEWSWESFRVGRVLVIWGLECCAQEFGLCSVNNGRPAKASKLRNDLIWSDSDEHLWRNHYDPGIVLNIHILRLHNDPWRMVNVGCSPMGQRQNG